MYDKNERMQRNFFFSCGKAPSLVPGPILFYPHHPPCLKLTWVLEDFEPLNGRPQIARSQRVDPQTLPIIQRPPRSAIIVGPGSDAETARFAQRSIGFDGLDVREAGETFVRFGGVVRVAAGDVAAETVGVGFDSPVVFGFGEAEVEEL